MNFMEPPEPGMTPNQNLKGPTLATAIQFMDELIHLVVIRREDAVVNNFPLFLTLKPAQEGEFHPITDGKLGGQNSVCVADPCQMTSPDHILPHLYVGGWSTIIDVTKYFHIFPTQKDEQKYMGIIHSGTGDMYVFDTFAMVTRNSPGVLGRFGAIFLRHIIATFPEFQDTPVDNSLYKYFTKHIYHLQLGEGRALVGNDGLPVVLLWTHVEDIFTHGPILPKL